jgi:hypothetical protein
MANLTVTIDTHVLRRARIRALEQGTSVNALVSDYLERYAGAGPTAEALSSFLALAAATDGSSGSAGRTWMREELHERADLR